MRIFSDYRAAWRRAVVVALMALTCGSAMAQTAVAEQSGSPRARAALEALIAAKQADRHAAWAELRAADAAERPGVIRELVLFAAASTSERAAMAGGAVIDEFDITPGEVVRAVVPLLESDDASVRGKAANLLGQYEQLGVDRPADFSWYREILAERVRAGEALPTGLIEHMVETDPGQALLALMRAHGIREPQRLKEILWAEHVVADAIWQQQHGFLKPTEVTPSAATELARLAADQAWWARLCAAEIVRRHAAFRTEELVKALQADPDERVRARAGRIPAD